MQNIFKLCYHVFFVCQIKQKEDGTNYLALQNPSTRGSIEEQSKRAEMFMDFQDKFSKIMADYRPEKNTINYDSMIDESYKNEVEENTSVVSTWC